MIFILNLILSIIPVFISVAFLTLMERKLLSIIGFRLGPNKISMAGIFQPISDAIKLSNKQINSISSFSYFFYYFSSTFMIMSTIILWEIFSFKGEIFEIKNNIILIMLVLAILTLKSIISGWSTFSKYSLMGSIRTLALLISYESIIYICLMSLILISSSFSLYSIKLNNIYLIFISPLMMYFWILSCMAELNRTPFDFSESESELVSGFNTEFGSKSFTLIFLAEYSNFIFISLLSSIIFFWNYLFFLFFLILIVWLRGVLPRYRFDKMMSMTWKTLIPAVTLMFIFFII